MVPLASLFLLFAVLNANREEPEPRLDQSTVTRIDTLKIIIEWICDEAGSQIGEEYQDQSGRLVNRPGFNYAIVLFYFDTAGKIIQQHYLNENQERIKPFQKTDSD